MTANDIINKYLPFTEEDMNCRIKKANKERLRDALKYDILGYAANQLKALNTNMEINVKQTNKSYISDFFNENNEHNCSDM